MSAPTVPDIPPRIPELFAAWAGRPAQSVERIPLAGSDRQYWRLTAAGRSAIGTFSPDARENAAFLGFSRHFKSLDLPVPEIYAADETAHVYLQQDLGSESLLQCLLSARKGNAVSQPVLRLYESSLTALARMQIKGAEGLDFGLCYPRAAFDKQSMLWDLSYFKYYFLKLIRVPFDEQALEDDFHALADYLLTAETGHFLFRDFQARNIMIHQGQPYFIDYQGGRRGALQYDVASLLFQAKADLPEAVRSHLLEHYLREVQKHTSLDQARFRDHYAGYVLIRLIQVLGAYGFRGIFERRPHFLESIPFGLENIAWWLDNEEVPVALPELMQVLRALPDSPVLQSLSPKRVEKSDLTVRVQSFSYKQGLPADPSGNGGGFIFDCRGLHNPGRYEPYKKLTGRDQPVIEFLQTHSEMETFLQQATGLVDIPIRDYIERGFSHLMISFGCTGGQHRSVYCADRMAAYIRGNYPVKVVVEHLVQDAKNWEN